MVTIAQLNLPPHYEKKLEYIVQELIQNLGEQIKEISIFGSCIKGKLKNGSDLDILVVPLNNSNRRALSLKIEYLDLRDDTGFIPVDIIVRTEDYLNNKEEFFSRVLREQRKVLWYNV